MKSAHSAPLNSGTPPTGQWPGRVPQLLIWVGMFLIAVLVAAGIDFLRESRVDLPVALAQGQALEQAPQQSPLPPPPSPTEPVVLPSASVTSTAVPTASPVPITPPPCVPPDDWGIHVVTEGNTLWSLAERYGSDVDSLKLVNCLNTDTIFIDQRLYVPGILMPTLPAPSPAATLPPATPQPGILATPLGQAGGYTLPTARPIVPPGPVLEGKIPNIYLNIVLLGSDKRPSSGAWRTDSMIIVSIDQKNQTVRLLSLPRDLWVYIPQHGYNRINTADLWGELAQPGGGPERVKQTIYHNLGIPIHYYVRIDFKGFIKIVDTLGGLEIDVEEALPDVNLEAGMQHLDGREALRYARSRYTTSDFDRGRRQRKLLTALWEKALTLDVIPRLPDLWSAMEDSFSTDLPLDEVINMAYLSTQLSREDVRSNAIDESMVQNWVTSDGAAVVLPREERIEAMLESFYAPVPSSQLEQGENPRVHVLNGCKRNEAGELASAALSWEGYRVTRTAEADRQDYGQTSIVVYGDDLAGGEAIAGILGVPTGAVTQGSDGEQDVDVLVILGADYAACKY